MDQNKGSESLVIAARVQEAFAARVGILGTVEALFMRILQQSLGVRPKFAIVPGKGVEVTAVIFLNRIPKLFEEHAERTAPVKHAASVQHGDQPYASAVGRGADAAVLALYDHLRVALKQRIESDLAVWERSTGEAWEGITPEPDTEGALPVGNPTTE